MLGMVTKCWPFAGPCFWQIPTRMVYAIIYDGSVCDCDFHYYVHTLLLQPLMLSSTLN